ncbi:hypothetical protein HK104_004260 [Borealophlyctis nickersoniae]|nr:hypothetical protein HK104_004260 [Borealophlyctis nickersoniae]
MSNFKISSIVAFFAIIAMICASFVNAEGTSGARLERRQWQGQRQPVALFTIENQIEATGRADDLPAGCNDFRFGIANAATVDSRIQGRTVQATVYMSLQDCYMRRNRIVQFTSRHGTVQFGGRNGAFVGAVRVEVL